MAAHIIVITETPATATDRIFFRGDDVYQKAPNEIHIDWNKFNLTTNLNADLSIELWGYRESTIRYVCSWMRLIRESSAAISRLFSPG